ncbi:MAG: hypothetical protein GDA56_10935 [Hormoscilla sp. GM7CHS1pb]|nr:hypothetical protein [Hormoscilla sp. GM7CHS1pb]
MYQRHVYVDRDKLTPDFMTIKHQITQQPCARFAPAAFVTGGLDPMSDREEWLRVGDRSPCLYKRSFHPIYQS